MSPIPSILVLGKYIPDDIFRVDNPIDASVHFEYRWTLPTKTSADKSRYEEASYIWPGDWHQDDLLGTPHPYIWVWSNEYPTEIQTPDGEIHRGDPYDVVLLRNDVVKHRTPADYVKDVRDGVDLPRVFMRAVMPESKVTWDNIRKWKSKLKVSQ